jgi:beta-carotene ketolase (CrtW type)
MIVGLWVLSLQALLRIDLAAWLAGASVNSALLVLAVLLRTFLQTGLFIVAHDAMHGSLAPASPLANHTLGRCALALYACLPYRHCRRNHHRHHRFTAQPRDPDYHDGRHSGPLRWYARFMAGYLSLEQMSALLTLWAITLLLLTPLTRTALPNLLIFWVLPLILSSIQLFVFGTYLPHHASSDRPNGEHRIRSTSLPAALSFLACYHFGCHWEHHAFPATPWYALPALRGLRRSRSASGTC